MTDRKISYRIERQYVSIGYLSFSAYLEDLL